jgi:hypothetical protein
MVNILTRLENATLNGIKLEIDKEDNTLYLTYIYAWAYEEEHGEEQIGGIEVLLPQGEILLRRVEALCQEAVNARFEAKLPDSAEPTPDVPN